MPIMPEVRCVNMVSTNDLNEWVLAANLERTAKFWWGLAMILRLFGFALGVAGIFGGLPSGVVVFGVALVGMCAEIATVRSDRVRKLAQELRRWLEFYDGMGWPVTPSDYSDLVVRSPSSVKELTRRAGKPEAYFESKRGPGPERALENLMESAWWSKHLAEGMRNYCAGVIALAVVASIATLLFALEGLEKKTALDAVARVVTSVLMLVVSLGLVKLIIAYHDFTTSSGKIEAAALQLQAAGNLTDIAVIKLLHKYQSARAGSPLLPDWVWKMRRDELNSLWRSHRTST